MPAAQAPAFLVRLPASLLKRGAPLGSGAGHFLREDKGEALGALVAEFVRRMDPRA